MQGVTANPELVMDSGPTQVETTIREFAGACEMQKSPEV
jgi:hypothetical protein